MSERELVDIYDDNLQKVGTATRHEAHKAGRWHLNLHCWIVSRAGGGSLLFQLRSRKKPTFPGLLDSTVGAHYRKDQTLRDVLHEGVEELGLRISPSNLRPIGRRIDIARIGDTVKREIANVFFLLRDSPLGDYRLERTEVEGLVQVPIAAGLKLFSGETKKARVKGLYWEGGRWVESERSVKQEDFVPKADSYYLTLFIMARRLLDEERYLSI